MEMPEMDTQFDARLFGLEPRDLRVYQAMLSFEQPASIRTIAEAARLNRGTTFEVIKQLVQAGLVAGLFKNKRKYYAAQAPESLQAYARARVETLNQELTKVDAYTQHLQRTSKLETPAQFTQFYDGNEEVAVLLRDVLDTVSAVPDKTYRVISSAEVGNHLYREFRNFTRQRIARGITARVIGAGRSDELAPLAERRFMSVEEMPACYVIIYGDKVAQVSLSDAGNVQGVVVRNSAITAMQTLVFDRLWQSLEVDGDS